MISSPKATATHAVRVLALAVLLTSPATLAEEVAEPRFSIEAIDVEGTRYVSPDILISESRLNEGTTYTEAELLEAVYRIRRLPFVLDAEMALERGSERGQLRLVIAVEEIRRYFFGGELLFNHFSDEIALRRTFTTDSGFRFAPIAGVRFSAGDYGLFFVAANSASLQAGYTSYQLFGRQALFSLGVTRTACCPVDVPPLGLDPTFSSWSSDEATTSASLTLGIPLKAKNQSLRFLASYRETEEGRRRTVFDPQSQSSVIPADVFIHTDSADYSFELAWISDSRDDPALPTRGDSLTASLEFRRLDSPLDERQSFDTESNIFVTELLPEVAMSSNLLRATFAAERHWPFTPRQALSLQIRLAAGRSQVEDLAIENLVIPDENFDVFEGTLSLRHAINIWRPRSAAATHELWWENTLDLGYEDTSFEMTRPLHRFSFTSALTFRNSWGLFRIGFSFIDVGRIT